MAHRPSLQTCSVLLFVLLLGQTADAYSSKTHTFIDASSSDGACSINNIIIICILIHIHGQLPNRITPVLYVAEYGRTCSDIGCLSSETCVMAHDSCSYNERENKDCGRYPTCKKSGAAGSSPGRTINLISQNNTEGKRVFTYTGCLIY